jgi:predicted transcriptional regulator
MVRSYRSRDEIIVDILKAASDGAKKTHIMQRANLNPLMFKKYFPILLRNGLIVEDDDPDGGSTYGLSDDGKEFLKMYRVLRAKLRKEIEGKPIQIL